MAGGGDPFYLKSWVNRSLLERKCEIADFQSIFAPSASAVIPREKSLINTNRKTTSRFLMCLRNRSGSIEIIIVSTGKRAL